MQHENNQVCLVLLPLVDKTNPLGYQFINIDNKADFMKHVELQHGALYGEEAFVILASGCYMTIKIDTIKEMEWISASAEPGL